MSENVSKNMHGILIAVRGRKLKNSKIHVY
jgi:hypothetical protein